MRLRSFLALLALTVVLVACGDDARTTTPTSAATTTVPASELDAMLLDARDGLAGGS
jgi:nitrous oxide reductase accessory protein NosL